MNGTHKARDYAGVILGHQVINYGPHFYLDFI